MRRSGAALVLAMVLSLILPARAIATTLAREWMVGIEPFGLTIDPRSGIAWIATSDHNNWYGPEYLWYIDPSLANPYIPPDDPAAVVLPRVQLPRAQVMSVLDLGLDRLFVTTNEGLAAVDVSSRTLAQRTPLARGGVGIDLDPNTHRLYVATMTGAAIVDGASGAVVAQVTAPSLADAWWHIAHDALRHRVYVANGNFSGAPSLVVLDDSDLSTIGTVMLPAVPRLALAFDAARDQLYVGGFSSGASPFGRVYAIDPNSLQVVRSVDVGAGVGTPMSFTLVGGTLWVSTVGLSGYPGNGLVALDLASFEVTQRVPLPFQPGQAAFGNDGRLYVTELDHASMAALELGNHPPVLRALSFSPAAPTTASQLTALVDAVDPDLGPGGFPAYPANTTYEWSRNGQPILDATGGTLDLAAAGHGDRGDTISVRVTVSDGEFSSSQTRSVVIDNAAPTVSVSLDKTAPRTNDVLHASVATSDADGDSVALTYTWTRNGVVLPGAMTADLDLAVSGDHYDTIGVTASVSDGHGGSASASASATVADTPPVAAISLNTTTPGSWDALIATATASDADGDPLSYTWYLKRNGTLVRATSGFPQAGFNLFDDGVGDRGDVLTVELLVGDGTTNVTTTATAVVVNSAPVVSFTLSSSEPRRTDTLVATASAVDPDGDSPITYTYTWSVGKKVRRVTTTTASTDSLDLRSYSPGDLITLAVTATDGMNASIPVTATARIAPR